MSNLIYYLVDKQSKSVSYAGPLPPTYQTITGLNVENYAEARDLSWAGAQYANKGFLTYQDALDAHVPQKFLDDAKAGAIQIEWNRIEPERQAAIAAQRWRVDRYNDAILMKITPPEDIGPVLTYIQQIRDLTKTYPNPFDIVWPTIPPLPNS